MPTGILVTVTLLVWHPGRPLGPCAGQGHGCRVGACSVPSPLASASGAGSELTTMCLGSSQGAAYMGRKGWAGVSQPHGVTGTVVTPSSLSILEWVRAGLQQT